MLNLHRISKIKSPFKRANRAHLTFLNPLVKHALAKIRPYLYIAPAYAYMGIFLIVPLLMAIKLSFTHPINPNIFPTLATWQYVFRQTYFYDAVYLTSFYAFATITLETGLGLIVATLINQKFRGRGVVRAIVLMPMGIPLMVAAASVIMLTSDSGIINGILWDTLKLSDQPFKMSLGKLPVILAEVWKMTPYCAIIILSGLEGIPSSVYDAAKTLGATRWQQFWQITLPLAWPAVMAAFTIRLSEVFKMMTFPLLLGKEGQGDVLSVWAYRMYINAKLSSQAMPQSRASAFALLMVGLALTYLLVAFAAYWSYKQVKKRAAL